jgi:hypothetical protein
MTLMKSAWSARARALCRSSGGIDGVVHIGRRAVGKLHVQLRHRERPCRARAQRIREDDVRAVGWRCPWSNRSSSWEVEDPDGLLAVRAARVAGDHPVARARTGLLHALSVDAAAGVPVRVSRRDAPRRGGTGFPVHGNGNRARSGRSRPPPSRVVRYRPLLGCRAGRRRRPGRTPGDFRCHADLKPLARIGSSRSTGRPAPGGG